MPKRSRFVAFCGLLVSLVSLAGCGGEVPTATPPMMPARTGPYISPPGTTEAGLATAAAVGTSPAGPFATPAFVVSPPPGITPAAISPASIPSRTAPTIAATVAQPIIAPTAAPMVALAPDIAIAEAGKWFNSEPLTLAKLRGKPVLLVFWSDI